MDNSTSLGGQSLYQERKSVYIRIWHWTFFALVMTTIIVVLFATQMFNARANGPLVLEEATGEGIAMEEGQARHIAHIFSEKLWVLHTWIGYGISIMLLLRFVIELVHTKEERLRGKIKRALGLVPANDFERQDRRHYLWVKRGYLVFYLLIFFMATTGLGLAFEDVPFLQGEMHHNLKEVHELGQYAMYLYVILHIGGVLWTDARVSNGLVSRMIHGKAR